MTEQKPEQTAAAAEATPRSGSTITPTPTQRENDQFLLKQAAGTLPHTWSHAMDGSAIDMQSPDPTAKTSSFP